MDIYFLALIVWACVWFFIFLVVIIGVLVLFWQASKYIAKLPLEENQKRVSLSVLIAAIMLENSSLYSLDLLNKSVP